VHGVGPLLDWFARHKQNVCLLAPQCENGRRWVETDWNLPAHLFQSIPSKMMRLALQLLEKTIREENIVITDETLSAQMDTLSDKCMQIFRTVSAEPSKAPQVRKFMSYYLPTTLKVLANYRTMQERGVSYYEMNQARESAVRCMDMVLTACQKQIDALHKENMLDISTDIDVMEQMLKRDGYVDNEILSAQQVNNARTAAEAQMRTSSAPVLYFPEENRKDEPPASSAAGSVR
jgi:hypothetical protein